MSRLPRSPRTIRDVARLAGVSIGTASKALNDKRPPQRRNAGEDRCASPREIDYRPNDLAQSLHRARSMTVGILSNDSFGRFTFPIVEALERRLSDQGIAVFMCNATDDPLRERRHIDQLLGKRIDGLVVTARRADRREPIEPAVRGLPVIYVFSRVENPNALCLLPDDEGGAAARRQAPRRARAAAHRPYHRPGAFRGGAPARGRLSRGAGGGRTRGAARAIFGPAHGRRLGAARPSQDLFSQRRAAPDALFCGNDQIARGAIDALREHGPRRSRRTSPWSASTTGK